ncbi:MAG: replication-associated recombination protein A [Puniceicoccales bacterium]|jgi:putative ATPase|nr:replication-associated recombination protein A [Puniceicoccales bacterium]
MDSHEQDEFTFDWVASDSDSSATPRYVPLAIKMRPKTLDEIVGQGHILGPKCLLPKLVKSGTFSSIIFYGVPGCGKTTLAEVIAGETKSKFVKINAVLSNVAELREILAFARKHIERNVLLFIDEIHRFNKAQQDLLLPDVENASIRLIGATTHNPGFYVISPLLSRSHLFRLNPISVDAIAAILGLALGDCERGLGSAKCHCKREVIASIATMANGDLRWALNALETIVASLPMGSEITADAVENFSIERALRYDADEDEHYDTISAYIKSMRGCDPDAAIFWLNKMLDGGEDPRFIARRMVIFASEDVALADPMALPLAIACFEACEKIGMPECAINLAHVTVFLAATPKSNSTYMALSRCRASVVKNGSQNVPLWLRDSHGKANERAGNQKDYLYSHNFDSNVSGQYYMEHPEKFWVPNDSGAEKQIAERMTLLEELRKELNELRKSP